MPHAELAVPGLILLVIGVALITLARFWPKVHTPQPTTAPEPERPRHEITGPVTSTTRTISWPALLEADAATLTDDERHQLLEGLGIIGDTWSAMILAKAFDEERGDLRIAAIEALGMCDAPLVAATLERAYTSYAVPERYAAVESASRRGDVTLLERALRDTDSTVALAAAYGLSRANHRNVVDDALAGREDARANEIRRVLPILA